MTSTAYQNLPGNSLNDWIASAPALGLKRRGNEWVGPCPSCGGDDRFHVKAGARTSVIGGCRQCEAPLFPDLAAAAFPERAAETTTRPTPKPTRTYPKESQGPTEAERVAYARTVWESAREGSADYPLPDEAADHPIRRWLAARRLWWDVVPTPPIIRWCQQLPADGWPYGGQPPRGGCLVVLLSPPEAWVKAWPDLPAPDGVECIFIKPDGSGIKNSRGHNAKITVGLKGVTIIGKPQPAADSGLRMCEGTADGMALAARTLDTVLIASGLPRASGPVFAYAADWPSVTVHEDTDAQGQGAAAATTLKAALIARGVQAHAVKHIHGKDAAEAASKSALPNPAPPSDVLDFAAALDAVPRWEALRWAAYAYTPSQKETPDDRARQKDGANPAISPIGEPAASDGRHKGAVAPTPEPQQGGLVGMPAQPYQH